MCVCACINFQIEVISELMFLAIKKFHIICLIKIYYFMLGSFHKKLTNGCCHHVTDLKKNESKLRLGDHFEI